MDKCTVSIFLFKHINQHNEILTLLALYKWSNYMPLFMIDLLIGVTKGLLID